MTPLEGYYLSRMKPEIEVDCGDSLGKCPKRGDLVPCISAQGGGS